MRCLDDLHDDVVDIPGCNSVACTAELTTGKFTDDGAVLIIGSHDGLYCLGKSNASSTTIVKACRIASFPRQKRIQSLSAFEISKGLCACVVACVEQVTKSAAPPTVSASQPPSAEAPTARYSLSLYCFHPHAVIADAAECATSFDAIRTCVGTTELKPVWCTELALPPLKLWCLPLCHMFSCSFSGISTLKHFRVTYRTPDKGAQAASASPPIVTASPLLSSMVNNCQVEEIAPEKLREHHSASWMAERFSSTILCVDTWGADIAAAGCLSGEVVLVAAPPVSRQTCRLCGPVSSVRLFAPRRSFFSTLTSRAQNHLLQSINKPPGGVEETRGAGGAAAIHLIALDAAGSAVVFENVAESGLSAMRRVVDQFHFPKVIWKDSELSMVDDDGEDSPPLGASPSTKERPFHKLKNLPLSERGTVQSSNSSSHHPSVMSTDMPTSSKASPVTASVGEFGPREQVGTTLGRGPIAVAVVDADNDGINELFISTLGKAIAWCTLQDNNGAFVPRCSGLGGAHSGLFHPLSGFLWHWHAPRRILRPQIHHLKGHG